MPGICKHETTSINELSGNPSAGYSTPFRCNYDLSSIGSLNKSIFRRLAPLFGPPSDISATDHSSFPHALTPVTTASPGTTFSNNSATLALIIASVVAASLFLLTIITLLLLKWRRHNSLFRLDSTQDLEALIVRPSPPPLIPSNTLQQTANNPPVYPFANGNLSVESSRVLGPRRTL